MIRYCDSYSANSEDGNISGYCYQLNKDVSLISWKSREQSTITLSTCEAEYMALCSPMQETNFPKQFYQNMKGDQVEINIYANNQSRIKI